MKLLAAMGCLLSLSSAAFATVTVPVTDRSPFGCPLANSGTVTMVERLDQSKQPWEGVTGEWPARNSSGKPVVATVTTVRVHYSNGVDGKLVSVEDFFWNPDLPVDKVPTSANLLPKGVRLTEGPISESTTAVTLRPSSVEVITDWVEFADGTTWGDDQNPDVRDYMLSRRKAIDAMRRLANVYDTQGPERFAREVEQLRSGSNAYHLRMLLEQQGGSPQLVIEKLRVHLQIAEARAGLL